MNATARAAAYLRQTGAQTMTVTQARRYRKKIFRLPKGTVMTEPENTEAETTEAADSSESDEQADAAAEDSAAE